MKIKELLEKIKEKWASLGEPDIYVPGENLNKSQREELKRVIEAEKGGRTGKSGVVEPVEAFPKEAINNLRGRHNQGCNPNPKTLGDI